MYQVWGCPAVTFACVLRVYKSQNLRALRGIFFFRILCELPLQRAFEHARPALSNAAFADRLRRTGAPP